MQLRPLAGGPGSCVGMGYGVAMRAMRGGTVKRNVLELILEGPRTQVPVECLDRNFGYSRPLPPPPPCEALPDGLEILDQDEVALDDAQMAQALGKAGGEVAVTPDPPTWVCPPHWLAPTMRAEDPTVWLDPEPLRLVGPVTIWLSARFENGGGPR